MKRSSGKINAYEFIRNAIFHGDLKPGTTITEEWLSKHLKISRTPVREALINLQADGLIIVANKRTIVAPITPVDIQEIYELRLLLEPYAARVCIGVIDKNEVRKIQDYTRQVLNRSESESPDMPRDIHTLIEEKSLDIRNAAYGLVKPGNHVEGGMHIHDIHGLIIDSTRNQRLVKITGRLHAQINLLLNAAERIPGRVVQSMQEHLNLIEAILADDPIKAEECMRIHIQTNMDDMLNPANFRFIFKSDG